MSVCLLVFMNSMAKDYAPVTLDRLNKYFPKIKSYLGVDSKEFAEEMKPYYKFDETIVYDAIARWPQKMIRILLEITEEYVFFVIDNNIFVDNFDNKELQRYIKYMVDNDIDQLRMIPSCVSIPSEENDIGIYENTSKSYVFSQQPAIWKKETLIEILDKFSHTDYRTIERESEKYCSQYKNYFVYSSKDFKERINNFSYACPIIHALSFRRWVNETPFYTYHLEIIALEYNIDLNKRGFIF
jgi:hypothetical protein